MRHKYPFWDRVEPFGVNSPEAAFAALKKIYEGAAARLKKLESEKNCPPLYEELLDKFYSYLDNESIYFNFKVKLAYQCDRELFRYLGEDKIYERAFDSMPVNIKAEKGRVEIEFPNNVVSKHHKMADRYDYTYAHFVDAAMNKYERDYNVELASYLSTPLQYTVLRIYKKESVYAFDTGNIQLDVTINEICKYLMICDNTVYIKRRIDEVAIRPDEPERTMIILENYLPECHKLTNHS